MILGTEAGKETLTFCNQAKDRPCNNCARRFPPVVCRYDSDGQSPSAIDGIMEFEVAEGSSGVMGTAGETGDSSPYYPGYGAAGQDYIYAGDNQLASSYSPSMPSYSTEYRSSESYPSRTLGSQALGSSSALYVPSSEGGYGVDATSYTQATRPNDVQYYSTSYPIPPRTQSYEDPRAERFQEDSFVMDNYELTFEFDA
ncbi:hypothetical protein B7463_g6533, partial [Scytalidium lignicola]